MPQFSRRHLLAAGAAAALPLPSLALASAPRPGRRPKNVIFLVSDGMSAGVPSMLDHFLQLTQGRPAYWRTLMADRLVHNAVQDTRSLSSVVTDSAAASSSWGSGRHVWNGQINQYPDGTKLTPLYELLKGKGMRRGLVSTATITHATPAGFQVSIGQRDREAEIAAMYLAAETDVLLGGGDMFFNPEHRKDKRDLYAEFRQKGYVTARTRAEAMAAPKSGRLLGLFSRGHVPYRVDRDHIAELGAAIPTLAEMTTLALERLRGGREGFVLQVEAARVDHAAHGNDLAGLLYDQLEFDEAVRTAMEFALKDKETLVVITSDHGNSNPGLNGSGGEYGASTEGLKRVAGMTRSYEALTSTFASGVPGYDAMPDKPRLKPELASVRDLTREYLDVELTEAEGQLVVDAMARKSPLSSIEQYALPTSALSLALGNHTHVGWTGRQHTDDYTLLTAFGPGAERFHGVVQNVSVFGILTELKGVPHENPPQMSQEDAARAMGKGQEKALRSAVAEHWA